MTTFDIVEAKAWHCGAMSRLLRQEHAKAIAMIGLNSHRELRAAFDESIFRRAWLIDGHIAALGGVTGSAASALGIVWLAVAAKAGKYPLEMIKEARRQIADIMTVKRMLICTILDGDEASERFAIFLGFVPKKDDEWIMPAETRYGRKEVARQLKEIDEARVALGSGYVRVMQFRHIEAA